MASLQSLHPAVMILLLSGFLLAVGFVVNDSLSEAVADEFTGEVELQNITNKNVTPAGSDASLYYNVKLSEITVTCAGVVVNPTTELVIQHSSGLEINYSCTAPCTYNNTNCTVQGFANTDRSAFTAVNSTSVAIANYPEWFGIIIVVIVSAIILGIVIRGFSGSTSM